MVWAQLLIGRAECRFPALEHRPPARAPDTARAGRMMPTSSSAARAWPRKRGSGTWGGSPPGPAGGVGWSAQHQQAAGTASSRAPAARVFGRLVLLPAQPTPASARTWPAGGRQRRRRLRVVQRSTVQLPKRALAPVALVVELGQRGAGAAVALRARRRACGQGLERAGKAAGCQPFSPPDPRHHACPHPAASSLQPHLRQRAQALQAARHRARKAALAAQGREEQAVLRRGGLVGAVAAPKLLDRAVRRPGLHRGGEGGQVVRGAGSSNPDQPAAASARTQPRAR